MDSEAPIVKTLVFPWVAHGHVSPFLHLSHKLALTKRFEIHFCSTPTILASIKPQRSQNDPKIHFIELPLPTLPDLPPHHHTTNNLPHHLLPLLIQAFQLSKPEFAKILDNLSPDLLIYDFFQPWAASRAMAMGIPAVFFFVMGAACSTFCMHMSNSKGVEFPFPEIYLTGREMRDLVVRRKSIAANFDHEDGDDLFLVASKLSRDVILVNSSSEVERRYFEYWSKLCHKRVLPVGTLVRKGVIKEEDSEILQWLDGKERSSVVYMSFGSENYFSQDQIDEVAKGLELVESTVGFIWVVRSPAGATDVVPEDFIRLNKDRGVVSQGWVPQTAILAHPSVGAFMSHCGWNAVMESIYFGVPMVAMPLKLDQPFNCRVAVGCGIAVEVAKNDNGKFNGEGLAKAINEVMVERGNDMRSRSRKMSHKVRSDKEEEFCEAMKELSRVAQRTAI